MTSQAIAVVGAPEAAAPLDLIAEFLDRACHANELDERLEIPGIEGATQNVVDSLNVFLDKLWVKEFQLTAKREMLEKVVEIRTNEVHEILDHVNTGFLLTLADGTVLDNFSRSCVDIFGLAQLRGQQLADLLGFDDRKKAHFVLAYQQVFEGFLPPEVSLGQLPSEFTLAGRTYSLQGAAILGKDGQVAKVFFTINDTTEIRKLEAENALRQALIEIVRQKDTFRAFLHETSKAFDAARESPSQVRFRTLLHTTKGNLGCYGLHDLAALVHSIEDSPEITLRQLQSVEDTLKKFLRVHAAIIGLDYPEPSYGARHVTLERLRPALAAIVREGSEAARRAVVDDLVRKLDWVNAGVLLAPLRGMVDRLAKRLDKPVSFEVLGQDVLVDPQRVGAVFANLGHLIRNAVDHGIEPADERAGKPPTGKVVVSCRETADDWVLEVSDDGRGIDLAAIHRAALAAGRVTDAELCAMSRDGQLRLIFLDRVTTKDCATEDSGRGVGTTALLDSVEQLRGSVAIASAPGEGTRITVRIPRG